MALRSANILSLCAGVGGLELGVLLALHGRGQSGRGVCYVEREAAAAASLVASMEAGWLHPAPVWSDMLTFDARPWRGAVHILASGDPCQDNSVAGKRAGADGERFLAPEVVRIAAECRPDLIFRENVPGNAAEQLSAIVPALERLGYCVAAGIFSSAETGNTMRRERLFIMARAGCYEPGSGRGNAGEVRGVSTAERRPENGALVSCGGGARVDGAGSRRHGDADQAIRTGRNGAKSSGKHLGGTVRRDAQGQQSEQYYPTGREKPHGSAGLSGGAGLPPAVILGPTDSRWTDVLDRWPELQPSLSQEEAQSHLRRGIDAMAHRIERLRATGNGVDPVVAAYAFLRLSARLAEGRTAGNTLLMERAA